MNRRTHEEVGREAVADQNTVTVAVLRTMKKMVLHIADQMGELVKTLKNEREQADAAEVDDGEMFDMEENPLGEAAEEEEGTA